MTDYAELLKTTVCGMNDAYRRAASDLQDVVAGVDAAVQNLTGGKLSVKLIQQAQRPRDTVLQLAIVEGQSRTVIGEYHVAANGYPIWVDPDQRGAQLNGRIELEKHFAEMMSNPSSALVVQLAFAMRQ